jgi:alkylhydroperoxidase/carboxymuconolactone decarboxylase family protein YurZ
VLAGTPRPRVEDKLDEKTTALVRLGALVAMDAPEAAYGRVVRAALGAGITLDELVEVLTAVAPSVGVARIVAAAPKLASAAGYDIDAALEGE